MSDTLPKPQRKSVLYGHLNQHTENEFQQLLLSDTKRILNTGCTVNFKSTTVSFKVHKTIYNDENEWVVIPNTQEAIIDQDTWDRV